MMLLHCIEVPLYVAVLTIPLSLSCPLLQWWKLDGTHVKRVKLKGAFGKYIKFSPDFSTFVTIDNAGQLYMLCELEK